MKKTELTNTHCFNFLFIMLKNKKKFLYLLDKVDIKLICNLLNPHINVILGRYLGLCIVLKQSG